MRGCTVEFEQEPDLLTHSGGCHNFSIKALPSAATLPGSGLPGDSEASNEYTDSSGDGGFDSPPDDSPCKPRRGWSYIANLVESWTWQSLYSTSKIIGYSLLLTPQSDSQSGYSLLWRPRIATLLFGLLVTSSWNSQQPLFNQIQEYEANQQHRLVIITVPGGGHKKASGRRGQNNLCQSTEGANNGLSGFRLQLQSVGASGFGPDGSGSGFPRGQQHTLGNNCWVGECRGICQEAVFQEAVCKEVADAISQILDAGDKEEDLPEQIIIPEAYITELCTMPSQVIQADCPSSQDEHDDINNSDQPAATLPHDSTEQAVNLEAFTNVIKMLIEKKKNSPDQDVSVFNSDDFDQSGLTNCFRSFVKAIKQLAEKKCKINMNSNSGLLIAVFYSVDPDLGGTDNVGSKLPILFPDQVKDLAGEIQRVARSNDYKNSNTDQAVVVFYCESPDQTRKSTFVLSPANVSGYPEVINAIRKLALPDSLPPAQMESTTTGDSAEIRKIQQEITFNQCHVCRQESLDQRDLRIHYKEKHPRKEFPQREKNKQCSECNMNFSSMKIRQNHQEKEGHKVKYVHKCKKCGLEFDKGVKLENHRKAVHPSKRRNNYYSRSIQSIPSAK